jgi:RNA-directed DNA polymerase
VGSFNHVQWDLLLRLVGKRLQDRRVLNLIEAFLKAGVMEGQLFQKTEEGTQQGGIVSPLLANIYLHEMDRYWWEKYGNLTPHERNKRRVSGRGSGQGQGNNRLIRYADDFLILTNGTRAEAQRLRDEFQGFLWNNLQLELSEEKTLVTHVEDGFDFLGFNVRRYVKPKGGTRPITLVKPSDKSVDRLKAKVRLMTGNGHCKDAPYTKMQAINMLLRGWISYYQHVNAKEIAHSLDFWVDERMLRWFMDHHRCGVRTALKQYQRVQNGRRKNYVVNDTQGQPIWLYKMSSKPITLYRDRKRTNPYLPYLTQEKVWETQAIATPEEPNLSLEHTWNGGDRWQGWTEARLARLEYDKATCVMCGSKENVDVHHLHRRRWNQREQGDDRVESLRTLCEACHIKVEQGTVLVNGNGAPDEMKVSRPVCAVRRVITYPFQTGST